MQDNVIIVTGGLGNLGRAVVDHLLVHGAKPVIVDRAELEAPPGAVVVGGVDLTEAGEAASAVGRAVGMFGRLDGLVNIAGTFRMETVTDGSVDTWDLLYRINLRTALNTSRAALDALAASKGCIVNIGAANAAVPATAGLGAYAASKAGVVKLTEALADELKDRHVRVNAVLPGVLDTPPNRRAMPDADFDRWVSPEALTDVIAFLLSPAARAVTGAAIPVKGRA